MWTQIWGQLIWGQPGAAVPALGFWGVLILGAMLGILAVYCLRRAKPRTVGAIAVGLALFIPISAGAVTLITFTNGTVADANQVNANFAALNPVSGFNEMISIPAIGTQTDVSSPTFVAPRAMTCTVNTESSIIVPSSTPVGSAFMRALKIENGVTSFASAPPQGGIKGTGYMFGVGGGNEWNSSQSRQFSVGAGATVSFGCRGIASGDFTLAHNMFCVVTYDCQ
jgi:IPTL-CTERM motif